MDGLDPVGVARTGARWTALDRPYAIALSSRAPAVIHSRRGGAPLVITAPHAAEHRRDGAAKRADEGTGGLAEALAEQLGCGVVTVRGVQTCDPNHDRRPGAFKERLALVLRPGDAVLDLHAMRRERELDACLGTVGHPAMRTLAGALARRGEALGLRVTVDTPFDATPPGTVTRFAQGRGHRALELELSTLLLDTACESSRQRLLLEWLDAVTTGLRQ